jgi:hypothetical protein
MEKEVLAELLGKNLIIGYVYGYDGSRKEYYFENTPHNIASFIILHKENANTMILTDMVERLILNTFGEFINQCPDQKLLKEILKDLIPMQMGEKEPNEILIADETEYQALLAEEDRQVTEAELRML